MFALDPSPVRAYLGFCQLSKPRADSWEAAVALRRSLHSCLHCCSLQACLTWKVNLGLAFQVAAQQQVSCIAEPANYNTDSHPTACPC